MTGMTGEQIKPCPTCGATTGRILWRGFVIPLSSVSLAFGLSVDDYPQGAWRLHGPVVGESAILDAREVRIIE